MRNIRYLERQARCSPRIVQYHGVLGQAITNLARLRSCWKPPKAQAPTQAVNFYLQTP